MPILRHQAKELLIPEVYSKVEEYMLKLGGTDKIITYTITGDELIIIAIELSDDSILSLGVILGLCIANGLHDSVMKK